MVDYPERVVVSNMGSQECAGKNLVTTGKIVTALTSLHTQVSMSERYPKGDTAGLPFWVNSLYAITKTDRQRDSLQPGGVGALMRVQVREAHLITLGSREVSSKEVARLSL